MTIWGQQEIKMMRGEQEKQNTEDTESAGLRDDSSKAPYICGNPQKEECIHDGGRREKREEDRKELINFAVMLE